METVEWMSPIGGTKDLVGGVASESVGGATDFGGFLEKGPLFNFPRSPTRDLWGQSCRFGSGDFFPSAASGRAEILTLRCRQGVVYSWLDLIIFRFFLTFEPT